MDFTVAVATFGDKTWRLAGSRAARAAKAQAPVIHVHGTDLAAARNEALERVKTPYIVYLDADDRLERGYVRAMAKGSADLRVPMVRYVTGRRTKPPRFPRVVGHNHECEAECLREGNWMVIGTAVRTKLLREAGGWRDYEWSEDWDVFTRCWLAGGTVERIPDAIYRAKQDPDGRNRRGSQRQKQEWHDRIYTANFG